MGPILNIGGPCRIVETPCSDEATGTVVDVIVGRDFDLAHIGEIVTSASLGHGRALCLVGQPGVGKSALLDHVAGEHESSTRVVRITGLESEADFGWSGLDALLAPFVDDSSLAALAAPRADAVRSALLLDAVTSAPSVRAVALAALDLLTAAATPALPLLVLVDDLHWLDGESRQVVEFVCRRIGDDYVAVVATSRTPSELPTRTLLELDRSSSERLLTGVGVRAGTVRRRLIDALGTNPMLLTETVRQLDPATLDGRSAFPDPLPMPRTLADQAHRRLDALTSHERHALLVLAALANTDVSPATQALDAAGHRLDELVGAERAEIVHLDVAASLVSFTHPTLRTAVYSGASAPDRRDVHMLLADVVALPSAARATHRALGTVGTDERAADDLEAAAMENWERGAPHSAGDELELAAALSELPSAKGRRLLRAAEAALHVGAFARADALMGCAADLGSMTDPVELALVRARALHLRQRDDEAVELLRTTADATLSADPEGAARLLLEALGPLVRALRVGDVLAVVGQLGGLAALASESSRQRIGAAAAAFGALGWAVEGGSGPEAAAALDAARVVVRQQGLGAGATFVSEVVAPMLSYGVRSPELLGFLDGLESQLRQAGAFVPLVSLLGARQYQLVGRDNPLAVAAGVEAMDLADEVGLPHLGGLGAQGVVIAAAVLGDEAAHERAAAVLLATGTPGGRAQAVTSYGLLHLGAGRLDDAVEAYEAVVAEHGMGGFVLRWEPDYLETLVRMRRIDEAASILTRLDGDGHTASGSSRFDRARAMMETDDERALNLFAAAVAHSHRVGELGNAGRTELCWGERLRRMRRRGEARRHLERAIEILTAVGAGPWVARAEAELASAGGMSARGRDHPVHELLSPQELRIARMVAAGASNRELGAALFISARTVESHLSAIFRKLSVRNRRELAARAVTDPLLRD